MREYIRLTELEKVSARFEIEARYANRFNEKLINQFIHILELATMVELGYDDLLYCLSYCSEGYEVFSSLADVEQYAEAKGKKLNMILAYRVYSLEQSLNFPQCFTEYSNVLKACVGSQGFLATCCAIDEVDSEEFYLVSK
ncbi:hypothetical protein [Pseudoalteromonas gelatinilytica]|uniref:hypothetical protein n=1 Tax=Pseudoalteromonas gelatinilytica TaxID=1703256 RepID=UPI0007C580A4|nr:hypothetical protein [Pseudoalteromonas gelatinilytica]